MKTFETPSSTHLVARPSLVSYYSEYWFLDDEILLVKFIPRTLALILFPTVSIMTLIGLFLLWILTDYSILGPTFEWIIFLGVTLVAALISNFLASRGKKKLMRIPAKEIAREAETKRIDWNDVQRVNLRGRTIHIWTSSGDFECFDSNPDKGVLKELLVSKLGQRLT